MLPLTPTLTKKGDTALDRKIKEYSRQLQLLHNEALNAECLYKEKSENICIACHLPSQQVHTAFIPAECSRSSCGRKNQYLFLIVPPYHGSTALFGLISTGSNTSTLCSAGNAKCEGQLLLIRNKLILDDRWNESQPPDWTLAVQKYRQWWDNSQCVLVDKSPPNVVKVRHIANQLRAAGLEPSFIFMTRSPCYMSKTFKNNKGVDGDLEFMNIMMSEYQFLLNNRFAVLHLRYEDLMLHTYDTVQAITNFMPCIGRLDPTDNRLSQVHSDRALSIASYAAQHPLNQPTFTAVPKHFFTALHYFGYV